MFQGKSLGGRLCGCYKGTCEEGDILNMLDVSAEEFRSSRNRQEAAAKDVSDSSARRLLLFYAVECGGKYQLLVNENKFLFSKLSEEDKGLGHDLLKLLKRIGIEQTFDELQDLHSRNQKQTVDVTRYHEMWRYGIRCKEGETVERSIEETLKKILYLLHENETRK